MSAVLSSAPILFVEDATMHASSAAATALVEYSDVSSEDFSDPETGDLDADDSRKGAGTNTKKPKPATDNQFTRSRLGSKPDKEGYDNYRYVLAVMRIRHGIFGVI